MKPSSVEPSETELLIRVITSCSVICLMQKPPPQQHAKVFYIYSHLFFTLHASVFAFWSFKDSLSDRVKALRIPKCPLSSELIEYF